MSFLSYNSSLAERIFGCSFAESFRSKRNVFENNASVVNVSHFDPKGKATFNGSTDYTEYNFSGDEFNSDEISILVEFWPNFEASDNTNHYLIDSSAGNRFIIYKDSVNRLIMYLGQTSVGYISLSVYEQYWKTNERNVIVVAGKSGNNKLWLNGHLVISSAAAWTAKQPTSFFIGATYVGTAPFKGKIGQVKIFKSLLEEQDVLNYYNNNSDSYEENRIIYLPMSMKNHDPENHMTKDISGNDNNASFGDGVTSSTYPYKLPTIGYNYISTASLRVPIVKTLPSTAITVLVNPKTLATAGGYLFDFRRNGGAGYGWIYADYSLAGYNATFYVDGKASNTCSRNIHAVTCNGTNYASTEGIDIGARYNYNALTNFLGHMKSFIVHDRQLTPLEIANLHMDLLRKKNNV